MKRVHRLMASATALVMCLSLAAPALADDVANKIQAGLNGAAAGYGQQKPPALEIVIGRLINAALSLLGALLLFYLLYGGYLWMTSEGDETKVKKARELIKNTIIGLVVIVLAYSIAAYVLDVLSKQVLNGGGGA